MISLLFPPYVLVSHWKFDSIGKNSSNWFKNKLWFFLKPPLTFRQHTLYLSSCLDFENSIEPNFDYFKLDNYRDNISGQLYTSKIIYFHQSSKWKNMSNNFKSKLLVGIVGKLILDRFSIFCWDKTNAKFKSKPYLWKVFK